MSGNSKRIDAPKAKGGSGNLDQQAVNAPKVPSDGRKQTNRQRPARNRNQFPLPFKADDGSTTGTTTDRCTLEGAKNYFANVARNPVSRTPQCAFTTLSITRDEVSGYLSLKRYPEWVERSFRHVNATPLPRTDAVAGRINVMNENVQDWLAARSLRVVHDVGLSASVDGITGEVQTLDFSRVFKASLKSLILRLMGTDVMGPLLPTFASGIATTNPLSAGAKPLSETDKPFSELLHLHEDGVWGRYRILQNPDEPPITLLVKDMRSMCPGELETDTVLSAFYCCIEKESFQNSQADAVAGANKSSNQSQWKSVAWVPFPLLSTSIMALPSSGVSSAAEIESNAATLAAFRNHINSEFRITCTTLLAVATLQGAVHHVLLIAYKKSKLVTVYDPLRAGGRGSFEDGDELAIYVKGFIRTLELALGEEGRWMREVIPNQPSGEYRKFFDYENFTRWIPLQTDGASCGPLVCVAGEVLFHRHDALFRTGKSDLFQGRMDLVRRRHFQLLIKHREEATELEKLWSAAEKAKNCASEEFEKCIRLELQGDDEPDDVTLKLIIQKQMIIVSKAEADATAAAENYANAFDKFQSSGASASSLLPRSPIRTELNLQPYVQSISNLQPSHPQPSSIQSLNPQPSILQPSSLQPTEAYPGQYDDDVLFDAIKAANIMSPLKKVPTMPVTDPGKPVAVPSFTAPATESRYQTLPVSPTNPSSPAPSPKPVPSDQADIPVVSLEEKIQIFLALAKDADAARAFHKANPTSEVASTAARRLVKMAKHANADLQNAARNQGVTIDLDSYTKKAKTPSSSTTKVDAAKPDREVSVDQKFQKMAAKFSPKAKSVLPTPGFSTSGGKDGDDGGAKRVLPTFTVAPAYAQALTNLTFEVVQKYVKTNDNDSIGKIKSEFFHDFQLTWHDLWTLRRSTWLNGEIIDAIVITQQMKFLPPTVGHRSNFVYMPTGMTRQIFQKDVDKLPKTITGAVQEMVKSSRWGTFPMNLGNLHWAVAFVNTKQRAMLFYDPQKTSSVVIREAAVCHNLRSIRNLVELVMGEKIGPWNSVDWPRGSNYHVPKGLGRQTDGCNCGIFACVAVQVFSTMQNLDWVSIKDMSHASNSKEGKDRVDRGAMRLRQDYLREIASTMQTGGASSV